MKRSVNQQFRKFAKEMNQKLFGDSPKPKFSYRTYRRGSNRCLACGLLKKDCVKVQREGLEAMVHNSMIEGIDL